jgi:hypothetical protein
MELHDECEFDSEVGGQRRMRALACHKRYQSANFSDFTRKTP